MITKKMGQHASSRIYQSITKATFFYHKGKKKGTKDTKLDVDDASLCVLCVPWCFLCENHVALGLFLKIRGDEFLAKNGVDFILMSIT